MENHKKEKIEKYLLSKYNRITIYKKELAFEMGISISTLDLRISKNIGIPEYSKRGSAKNASVEFNVFDVAEFLSTGQTKTL